MFNTLVMNLNDIINKHKDPPPGEFHPSKARIRSGRPPEIPCSRCVNRASLAPEVIMIMLMIIVTITITITITTINPLPCRPPLFVPRPASRRRPSLPKVNSLKWEAPAARGEPPEGGRPTSVAKKHLF